MLSCYTPDGGTHGMMANTKTWGDSFNYMCGAMGTCTAGWDDLHKKLDFRLWCSWKMFLIGPKTVEST